MLKTFLDGPEDHLDYLDPDFSLDIARHLRRIYARPVDVRFRGAHVVLEPLLDQPMGLRQRIRAWRAAAAAHQYEGGVAWGADYFDVALVDAQKLGDPSAFAVLGLEQTHLHYVSHSIVSARDYALDALEAFSALPDATLPMAPDVSGFGLTLLWELATQHFLLEEHTIALDYVENARRLARSGESPHHREASIAWAAALIYRWLQRPIAALAAAREGTLLFERYQFGLPEERARMAVVLAEVAMDAAEHLSPTEDDVAGTMTVHLLEEASRYLYSALIGLARADDYLGLARARLVETRLSRLMQTAVDRETLYTEIEQIALVTGDRPLECQVWTERGDNLRASEQESGALACYRAALDAIARSDASAMGMWARRALLDAFKRGE
jgi:hypothetical protein